jgi:hypothetical protein
MGYCDDEEMVRVDFFKKSGKWYASQAIKMPGYHDDSIHDALKDALNSALYLTDENRLRYAGMTAVCLEPYHKHSHPLMVVLPEEGMFELSSGNTWTHRYEVDRSVEIQVCRSPEEWEEAVVFGRDAEKVVVKYSSGPQAKMIGIKSPAEIRLRPM